MNSLWAMFKDIKDKYEQADDKKCLDIMHLLYSGTNRTTHANAAGNAQRIGREYESNVIDTAPNWTGQGIPLYFSTMSMTVIMLYVCDKYHIDREKLYEKMNGLLCFYNSHETDINGGREERED